MERTYFTAPPTAPIEERTRALSGQLDPLYRAAERVLRCTAAAWALPAPAQLDGLRLAGIRGAARERQPLELHSRLRTLL